MKSEKQIRIGILIVVLAGMIIGGYVLYKNKQRQHSAETANAPAANAPNAVSVPASMLTAWDIFEQYLDYLKNHDSDKVKTVVSEKILEQNESCPLRQVQAGLTCGGLMDAAYKEGVKLKKADFVYSWEDAKQVVLSTKVAKRPATMPNTENYGKYYIYFTKDKDGIPKVLNFYGIMITFLYGDIAKVSAKDRADMAAKAFSDADKDGLLDKNENCVSDKDQTASLYNYSCSTTSRAKKDSVGDGWWDGVRVFFGDTAKKS